MFAWPISKTRPAAPVSAARVREPVSETHRAYPIVVGSRRRTPGVSYDLSSVPVRDVLASSGRPLDTKTRAHFEPLFGADFGGVRIHDDVRAARSARVLSAAAYTVGSDIVIEGGARGSLHDRRVLAHELAHVVQWQNAGAPRPAGGPVSTPGMRVEREADAAASRVASGMPTRVFEAARGGIHRLLVEGPGTFGKFSGDMHPEGKFNGEGGKENISITFEPDPSGPQTDSIEFVQIARTQFKDRTWGQANPRDKDVDRFTTARGDRIHTTGDADTLASIAQEHYGDPAKATTISQANVETLARGGNAGWPVPRKDRPTGAAQPAAPPGPTAVLPKGLRLLIPDAVEAGFHVDVDVQQAKPRTSDADPNVSAQYPNYKWGTTFGFNHGQGSTSPVTMTDKAGGGVERGPYDFESVAHARDIGISYGAVRWGFRYSPMGISDEWARVLPAPSDTVRAAIASLNRFYGNQHVVQAGETLKSIAEMYGRTAPFASSIYEKNKDVLKSSDPTAAIPPGTKLKVPGIGPSIWDRARQGSKEPQKKDN